MPCTPWLVIPSCHTVHCSTQRWNADCSALVALSSLSSIQISLFSAQCPVLSAQCSVLTMRLPKKLRMCPTTDFCRSQKDDGETGGGGSRGRADGRRGRGRKAEPGEGTVWQSQQPTAKVARQHYQAARMSSAATFFRHMKLRLQQWQRRGLSEGGEEQCPHTREGEQRRGAQEGEGRGRSVCP